MTRSLLILFLMFGLGLCPSLNAAEERFQDVVASVVVGSTFELSVDKNSLDFGLIKPGEKIELYPGRPYNKITCISNNNRTWYLKMYALNNLAGNKGQRISLDNLKWKVDRTTGSGSSTGGWNVFTEGPNLIYTSGPVDSKGEEVIVQMRYRLDTPANADSGFYTTTVTYSMTETP